MRKFLVAIVVIVYGMLFFQQERFSQQGKAYLEVPLPGVVQKVVWGYLRQLGGVMHFIKSAVFIGGHFTNFPDERYATGLGSTLEVAADLHPHFLDTYFLCEASLPQIGQEQAVAANRILKKGISALPENLTLPFFLSFNLNHYLNEKQASAEVLYKASEMPGAPSWWGHLASIRNAEGGDIAAGLIWLKAMIQTENDENVKERYRNEIAQFEKAVLVQKAVFAFRNQNGFYPAKLEELVPEFLERLPVIDPPFMLSWQSPELRLDRQKKFSLPK
jgi:hypothetical protein